MDKMQSRLLDVLYCLGIGLVYLGAIMAIAQVWGDLMPSTRILIALGLPISALVIGWLVSTHTKAKGVGNALYLVSSVSLPGGVMASCAELGCNLSSLSTSVIVLGLLFAIFVSLYLLIKNSIFALFGIVYGSWLYINASMLVVQSAGLIDPSKTMLYMTAVLGVSYCAFGYAFKTTKLKQLSWVLFMVGSVVFLGSTFFLGGSKPSQDVFWELAFPILAFGAIFLGAYVKERAFQVFGTLFLVANIFKITLEYFSGQIGWSCAIMIAGIAMIGAGLFSAWLNKKLKK